MLGTSVESKGGIGTVVRGFKEDICLKGYSFEHFVTHADVNAANKMMIACKAYTKCLLWLKPNKYDLVHVHSAFGASFTRSVPFIRLALRRGIPVVNHLHADDWVSFYESASSDKRKLIADTYNSCEKIIVLSAEWAETLSSVVPRNRLVILENFTPLFEKDYWPKRCNKTIVFMSRLERIKGCDILPEICERVLCKIPDATFLIGGEGSMRENLQGELEKRQVGDCVKLLGWVDGEKKVETLKRASLFLLPSYGEGMPMCILEAMGLGLPVVATRVGGVPQIVQDGENGILCAPGDAAVIADSITGVLEDEELYKRMSHASKLNAEMHSIHAYSEQLESIYDEILG